MRRADAFGACKAPVRSSSTPRGSEVPLTRSCVSLPSHKLLGLLPGLLLGPLVPAGLACNDYGVQAGVPAIALSTELIDFGEIVVGNQATIGILVGNEGLGALVIEAAELDGTTSPDFALVDVDALNIGQGEQAELRVRYVPDLVGQDYGRVALVTNDPEAPIVNVDLQGFGVEPEIDLNPDLLWFGEIAQGDSSSLVVEVQARGSGTLRLTDIAVEDAVAGAYSVAMPEGLGLPYELRSGTSVELFVTFSPPDEAEWKGDLVIQSNAPSAQEARVELLGNTLDDPTGNAAPVVSINDPDWGEYFLLGDLLSVSGVVYDEEDPPTSLVCFAYAGSIPLGSDFPDDKGRIDIPSITLPVGDVHVTLRCVDTAGLSGEDSVDVQVWDVEDPLPYVLTGGPTIYDWWSVDDDIQVDVDAVSVFADTNHTQDSHPPVEILAERGQTVRVVVTDYNYCDALLSPLFLHFGTDVNQPLIPGFCWSACPTHECYDPDYMGPWPGVIYEFEAEITIP